MLIKKEKEALEYFSINEVELSGRPFLKAAEDLGMSEPGLVSLLNRLQKRGIIKNLRGLIDHRKAGYGQNALIAWRSGSAGKLSEEKLVKDVFLTDERISHCYRRKSHKAFDFNIFTMMHAKTKNEITAFAEKTAQVFKFDKEVLFTEKELKKKKLDLREVLC